MIIGNRTIQNYFERAVESGNLHHGYCFIGPSQVGKRTVAQYIASLLLKVPVERLGTQPDFLYVERMVDEKTGKLPKELGVAVARDLREKLQGRSWLGGYRVVIINEAELLSTEASNALLKTLEEPPEKTIIFLLTENEEWLLPTIRSRVHMFTFGLVPQKEITLFLQDQGVGEQAALLAALAGGRPGFALNLHTDPAVFETWKNEAERWAGLIGSSLADKLKRIESLFKEEEGERVAEKITNAFLVWTFLFREALLYKNNGVSELQEYLPPSLERFSLAAILGAMDCLAHARELIVRNVQPRLAVEQAIIDF